MVNNIGNIYMATVSKPLNPKPGMVGNVGNIYIATVPVRSQALGFRV
jgi:hypothetical protein